MFQRYPAVEMDIHGEPQLVVSGMDSTVGEGDEAEQRKEQNSVTRMDSLAYRGQRRKNAAESMGEVIGPGPD